MAILQSTGIRGFLVSVKKTGNKVVNSIGKTIDEYTENFLSGFAGHGWKLWEYISGKYKLEIDVLMVRGTFTVFELLVQKIRSIKGALGNLQVGDLNATGILSSSNRIFTGYDSGVANSISCSNWFRSSGNTGWHNATYGGGINMIDSTYVRVSYNKAFKVTSTVSDSINTDGGILAGGKIEAHGDIVTDSEFINTGYPSESLLQAGGGATTIDALPFKTGSIIQCATLYLDYPTPGANVNSVLNSFSIMPYESQD